MNSTLRRPSAAPESDGAPTSATALQPSRTCIHCGKALRPYSYNTRTDVDYHKRCYPDSDEFRELSRLMAAVNADEDAFEGLV